MAIVAVKIHGVRIHQCVPVTFSDGTVGTEALVDEKDIPELEKTGMLAWRAGVAIDSMPARWKNKAGQPLQVWLGHHYATSKEMAEAEAAAAEPIK